MQKRKKMTWEQNDEYHTRMYVRQRDPVKKTYHYLCMIRASQHLRGKVFKNQNDLRGCSSNRLFKMAEIRELLLKKKGK